jgi:adenylate cyclase class 2
LHFRFCGKHACQQLIDEPRQRFLTNDNRLKRFMIEVEYKYAVNSLKTLQSDLERLNAEFIETVHQEDLYFDHFLDDFRQKDIAFRVRKSGSASWLTYKGPNQDAVGKIREEHEVKLENAQAADVMQKILVGSGFRSLAPVRKSRERYCLMVDNAKVEFCLDQVEGLGAFAEIELVVKDQSAVATAKEQIQTIATQLGLSDPIRTSYLDLLQQQSA